MSSIPCDELSLHVQFTDHLTLLDYITESIEFF